MTLARRSGIKYDPKPKRCRAPGCSEVRRCMSPRHHAANVLRVVREGMTWDEAMLTVPEHWRELVKSHLRAIKARQMARRAA